MRIAFVARFQLCLIELKVQQPQEESSWFAYVRHARHCEFSEIFFENRFEKSAKNTIVLYMPNFVRLEKNISSVCSKDIYDFNGNHGQVYQFCSLFFLSEDILLLQSCTLTIFY